MMRRFWVLLVALAVVLSLLLGKAQQPRRFKPVSFALLEDYDKGEDLASVEADFKLFEALEIKTWRGSFGWDDYEPERGRDDYAWLHQFAELAERHDIELRPYLGYTPEWAATREGTDGDVWNNPPARLQDWQRFTSSIAAALARHANVRSIEIYNEENAKQWWDGSPRQYADVLVAGSRAIRARNPRAPVFFGGIVYPDTEWIQEVCGVPGAGASFSVLPIHSYAESWLPPDVTVENYLDQLSGFLPIADRACGRKPIWLNEVGFPTDAAHSERDQAHWWVRAIATFLAHPRVEHIGVYEIKDLMPKQQAIGDAVNYHLGITRADRTKKVAFYTIDLLTDLLDKGQLSVDDDSVRVSGGGEGSGDVYFHLFTRPDGDQVFVIWTRGPEQTVSVQIPGVRASLEFDVDSRPLGWDIEASVLRKLALTPGVPRIFRLMP
jgi:polysaccharide biosynthesis protein PslG